MFGDRQVLYQEVETEEDFVSGDVAETMGAPDPDLSLEVPPDETERLDPNNNPTVLASRRPDAEITYLTGRKKKPEPKRKPIARLKGELPFPVPARLQQLRNKAKRAEKSYAYARGITVMNAGSRIASSYDKYAKIAEADAEKIEQLNDEHFSKWEAETEAFKKDIDNARAMKVNPNRYYQSIGTGGRVAATFAVGVSQLAAGAGNVSSVMKRLEAAIKRDVAAQESNIKQAWEGVAQMQNQQKLERQMFADYITYKDKATALHYTALAAKIGSIKQNAQNEMEYYAYQMIEDRFNAATIDAIAAALASMGTLHVDIPIHNLYEVLVGGGFITEANDLMRMGDTGSGEPVADTILHTPVDSPMAPTGLVGPQGPIGGPAPSLAAPTLSMGSGQPQAAPGGKTVPRTRAGSAGGSRPSKGPGTSTTSDTQQHDVPDSIRRAPEVSEEAKADIAPTTPEGPEREAAVDEAVAIAKAGMTEAELRAGSSAKVKYADMEGVDQWDNLEQQIRELAQTGKYELAYDLRDAQKLQEADKRLNQPVLTEFLSDKTRALYEANADLSPEQAAEVAAASRKVQAINIRQKDARYYMRRLHTPEEGKHFARSQNYIEAPGGGFLYLQEGGSFAGGDTPEQRGDAQKLREEVQSQFGQVVSYIDQIASVTDGVQKHGTGAVMGLFSFTDENEGSLLPVLDENYLIAMGFREGIANKIGAQVMKLIDKSGRLTDMDIKVGKAIGMAMANGWKEGLVEKMNATLGWAFGEDRNAYREAQAKVTKLITMAVVDQMYTQGEHSKAIFPTADAQVTLNKRREDAERWILSKKTEPGDPKYKTMPPKHAHGWQPQDQRLGFGKPRVEALGAAPGSALRRLTGGKLKGTSGGTETSSK